MTRITLWCENVLRNYANDLVARENGGEVESWHIEVVKTQEYVKFCGLLRKSGEQVCFSKTFEELSVQTCLDLGLLLGSKRYKDAINRQTVASAVGITKRGYQVLEKIGKSYNSAFKRYKSFSVSANKGLVLFHLYDVEDNSRHSMESLTFSEIRVLHGYDITHEIEIEVWNKYKKQKTTWSVRENALNYYKSQMQSSTRIQRKAYEDVYIRIVCGEFSIVAEYY